MRNVLSICLGTVLLTGCVDESVRSPITDIVSPTVPTDVVGAEPSWDSLAPESLKDITMPDEVRPLKYNKLTEFEEHVLLGKGTERPYVGDYTDTEDPGTYICRRCNAALYKADHKFKSDCGWPAFDDEIAGAVERHRDEDGYRVEIVCKNCGGHLGHVFEGERLTEKNVRHCVNSISMIFVPKGEKLPVAVLASDVAPEQ